MSICETSIVTRSHIEGEIHKIPKISKRTLYEKIVYNLDVLVPEDENDEIFVPKDSFLQQVHHGHIHRWRVQRNAYRCLPEYLTDHLSLDEPYIVINETKGILSPFDLASPFLKKWDALSFILLIYTASVTPWQTAFITGMLKIDTLFLISALVDLIFLIDMFIQMRTPYRDAITGKLIRDVRQITVSYLKSWFLIDLVSVLPFEMFALLNSNSVDFSQLRLLRFLRLTRLLKLIRVIRASRKLKQWQVHSGLRIGTIHALTTVVTTLFVIHWIACGYRLVADGPDPSIPSGWVGSYFAAANTTSVDVWDVYLLAMFWSASTVSLIGNNYTLITPKSQAEHIFSILAYFISYLLAGFFIASTANCLNLTTSVKMSQDVLVDNYLRMFDTLKLDKRLKHKIIFAAEANKRQTKMLRDLPVSLHGFISLEMFLPFIEQIPYLEVFIDRDPQMIQDICRLVEIRTCAPNSFLFTDGFEGIYFIEYGIVAIEGKVYTSGSIIGQSILRETIKKNECRAITDVQYFYIPRVEFIDIMDKFPKVKYYAKRWTAWQLVRDYIYTYTRLYFTAAKRGAKMVPPLLSMRPTLADDAFDELDLAVLDHIADVGF
ncbi:hypothetical protein BASA62_001971 [Batrachochytrium salamandrivorans]|nr:hypothetical protein BASA62_001971 [Batrachochytrium salamandrivorans]